jgi:hypothetical protein
VFRSRPLLVGGALAACLMAPACRTAPPPLDPTPIAPQIAYRLLVAPDQAATAAEPAARIVRVAIRRLRTPPPGVSVDVAASAIRSERGAPFRGASVLAADCLWARGDALAAWLADGPERQRADDEREVGAATAVSAPRFATDVRWAPTSPTLRLLATADGMAVRIVPSDAGDAPRQEIALAGALANDEAAVLFVPDEPASPSGVAVLLQVGAPATADEVAAAMAAAPAPTTVAEAPPVWQFALAAIGEHNRRPALLAVARSSGLPRCIDLLLAADERALVEATAALAALTVDERALPHRVEGALLGSLLPRLDRDDLPPGLLAALRRQLGAGCDDTAELRRMLQHSPDCDAFARALREENLAALDDRSAAVRVRAHDWLGTHGGALPDFDPLGPAKERRAVLRRCLLQAADAGGPTGDAGGPAGDTSRANGGGGR